MPTFDWQLLVALLAVAAAAWFLIRRALKSLRTANKSSPECGSCTSCTPTTDTSAAPSPGFVPLEKLTRHDDK